MLKRRIISKLLVDTDGKTLVKFKRFTEGKRIVGNPVSTMKILSDMNLDEFNITFLGAADPVLVREMTADVFTPVTVAGSIKTMDVVDRLIGDSGADKVVITDADFAEKVAAKYGNQAVVWDVSYDEDAAFFHVPDCAGEVMLTSIERDGTGVGFDLAALRFPWTVPVVLAGGCGRLSHVKDAMDAGADAVAVASMFAFTDKSPIKLRSWLVSEGAKVRAA